MQSFLEIRGVVNRHAVLTGKDGHPGVGAVFPENISGKAGEGPASIRFYNQVERPGARDGVTIPRENLAAGENDNEY